MKNILFSIFVLSSFIVKAQDEFQEYYHYPSGQYPYQGGEAAFYKDFHEIVSKNGLQPCENKDEVYNLKVIIPETGPIKYLKDETNKDAAEKYKCTYDLGLKVVSLMNKWKPIIINGEKKQSVAQFYIISDHLFEKYKEGYIPSGEMANYKHQPGGGINSFRKQVAERIDTRGYNWSKSFTMIVTFVVNTDGETEDYKVLQSSGLPEFDERVLLGIKSVKGKKHQWTPGKIDGVPVKTRFRLPLRFGAPE
jgi:TonB family protein